MECITHIEKRISLATYVMWPRLKTLNYSSTIPMINRRPRS